MLSPRPTKTTLADLLANLQAHLNDEGLFELLIDLFYLSGKRIDLLVSNPVSSAESGSHSTDTAKLSQCERSQGIGRVDQMARDQTSAP